MLADERAQFLGVADLAMVSPAWLTLSNWTIWICSILLIMGSFAPRFHHNRFRVEPVFKIMAFAATALFPQFIGFLAIRAHRPFGNS